MKLVLRFLQLKDKLALFVCLVCVTVQSWLELKIPEFISEITLRVQSGGVQSGDLARPVLLMLACAFGGLFISVLSSYCISGMSSNLTTNMRSAVFKKTMAFSLGEMGRFGSASLITRCTKNINYVYQFWANGALFLMKAAVLAPLAIIKMSGSHPAWLGSTAVSVVLMLVIMALVFIFTVPRMIRLQTCTDDENRFISEHWSGIRVMHAFNADKYEEKRFAGTNSKLTALSVSIDRGMAFLLPGMITVIFMLTIAIYWIGAKLIAGDAPADRAADYANMIAFSSYAILCVQAFVALVNGLIQVPGFVSSVKRIREVLDSDISVKDGSGAEANGNAPYSVEFRNVSFRYPGAAADAVSNVSFTAKPGETVAFIGATGCGKTTLLNLIPRLYDATEGEVLINGADVREYKIKDLRDLIGYVPQKANLFARTIEQNINFGDSGKEITHADVVRAAQIGQAEEFIFHKPEGYGAQVLPGGSNFSGGQKQRLTISRAVCRDPQIYLFDDSFSALDFRTDKKLRSELRKHAKGATVLIVAQRISTIRNADKIIVLDSGKAAGCGKHEELLKTCPIYREIAETQQIDVSFTGKEACGV